jgi:hypothetical protein
MRLEGQTLTCGRNEVAQLQLRVTEPSVDYFNEEGGSNISIKR